MTASAPASVESIRTLALVGATGSGKTTLAEALLHASGAIGAIGSVERGSTVSDHDPMEVKAQHSLQASVLHLEHAGCRVHLIDTPGLPDFSGQSLAALEAVETAAIVISAAAGIEPMARRMMAQAAERQLDRLIIVNKIDAEGVDLAGLLADIQASFGKPCLPLNLPDAGATRVVDCFYNREGHSDFGAVADAHRALVEQVVEVDAAFVDRYLSEGDVDASELHAPLEQALREGHLVPVCFVSARSGAGVAELLDVIARLLANPTEGNPPDFLNGEGEAAQLLHAQVQLAQAAHDGLVRTGGALQPQAGVFGHQLGHHLPQALLVAAPLGAERHAMHRHWKGQRLQVHVLMLGGVVQHGVELQLVHLGDGADRARAGRRQLGMALALLQIEVAHLEGLAPVADIELGARRDGALVHAHKAEL
ncbi:MAG: GTP-binding protein, partial [Proteobacteria bacterium]|nr:GTP-binding protein [Pseudomonadota bacterium]